MSTEKPLAAVAVLIFAAVYTVEGAFKIELAPLDIVLAITDNVKMSNIWLTNNMTTTLSTFVKSKLIVAEEASELDVDKSDRMKSRIYGYACSHVVKSDNIHRILDWVRSQFYYKDTLKFHTKDDLDDCLSVITVDVALSKVTPGTKSYSSRVDVDTVVIIVAHDEETYSDKGGATAVRAAYGFLFYLLPLQAVKKKDYEKLRASLAKTFADDKIDYILPFNDLNPEITLKRIHAVLCGYTLQCTNKSVGQDCQLMYREDVEGVRCGSRPRNLKCPKNQTEADVYPKFGKCPCRTGPRPTKKPVIFTTKSTTTSTTTTKDGGLAKEALYGFAGACLVVLALAVIVALLVFCTVRVRRYHRRKRRMAKTSAKKSKSLAKETKSTAKETTTLAKETTMSQTNIAQGVSTAQKTLI